MSDNSDDKTNNEESASVLSSSKNITKFVAILKQIEELSSQLSQSLPNDLNQHSHSIDQIMKSANHEITDMVKLSPEELHNNNDIGIRKFELRWRHITSAIQEELYLDLAISISTIVQENNISDEAIYYTHAQEHEDKSKKGIEFILEKVKLNAKLNVDVDEIQYIRNLIKRAKSFKPQTALIGMIPAIKALSITH